MEPEVVVEPSAPPVEVSTPVPEETAPSEEPKVADEPKPEKTFSQSDLDRILAKERSKAERKAERYGYERAMREAAERQLQSQSQPPVARAEGKPSPEQFRDYDSYMEALTDWKVEQKLIGVGEATRQARARAEAERTAAEVQAKLAPASEKYPDFEEVVLSENLPITRDMAEAILELGDVGHDVAYFLGTHPKEAQRISGLGRVAQLREIDKISATLTKAPSPTKAPAPIQPNKGTGHVEKKLEDADYDEFVKIRRRQIAARR